MKKIAIFTGYFLPHLGGVERYTDKLCVELHRLGYETVIVTTNHDNLESIEEQQQNTIYRLPIYSIVKERYPILKKNQEFCAIMEKLQNEEIDSVIINTRFYLTSLLGANYAKKRGIPSCIIEHGTNHFTVNNAFLDFFGAIYEHLLTHQLKKKVTDFYGVSHRCIEWLKHFNIEAKGVFYNAIDTKEYDRYKEEEYNIKKQPKEIIITYAGRVIKEKGVGNLIEAFHIVKETQSNIRLVIAGDGNWLEELKQQYKNVDSILFTDTLNHNEVMALYNVTDIFVHPSMYPEGLPTSILEAGLMKCAIIATDRGGTIEVVQDGENGSIVKENVPDLVEKLRDLLVNSVKREEYQEKIHATIMETFSWEYNAKKIVDSIQYK